MTKILLISGDTINSNMGGVGVRNWELANALALNNQVTLAVPGGSDLSSEKIKLHTYDLENDSLLSQASEADVIILHGSVLHFHSYLRDLEKPLAVDLYVPNLLESLVWHDQDDWAEWIPAYDEYLRLQLDLLRIGDFFFCASERQRDYWLGWLHAQKRINPHTYREDPTLRKLIDVVPFGIPEGIPRSVQPVLKGVINGIDPTDRIILWSGGLWDWLDPLTLIRAMGKLSTTHPDIKLYFMGTHHPNPVVTGMSMPEKAIRISKDLGVYNKSVFFGEWTPYDERESFLAEADLAVISHPGHIETRFSFRTRILDCIWASLPIITTDGDTMADWVKQYNLGLTVPPGDVDQMVIAIESMLKEHKNSFRPAFSQIQNILRWDIVVSPLANFCKSPSKATDVGKYLILAERIKQEKDTQIEQIIKDKNAYLEQVIIDKDAYLAQVVIDKDAYMEQSLVERDQIIQQQEKVIAQYREMFPLRIIRKLNNLFRKVE